MCLPSQNKQFKDHSPPLEVGLGLPAFMAPPFTYVFDSSSFISTSRFRLHVRFGSSLSTSWVMAWNYTYIRGRVWCLRLLALIKFGLSPSCPPALYLFSMLVSMHRVSVNRVCSRAMILNQIPKIGGSCWERKDSPVTTFYTRLVLSMSHFYIAVRIAGTRTTNHVF